MPFYNSAEHGWCVVDPCMLCGAGGEIVVAGGQSSVVVVPRVARKAGRVRAGRHEADASRAHNLLSPET